MQIIVEVAVTWWMVIAFYQFFDFLTDEILYSDNYLKSVPRVAKAIFVIPIFPVMTVFTQVLGNILKVKIDEAIEQED